MIRRLKTGKELKEAFDILKELRTKLTLKEFLDLKSKTKKYKMYGLFFEGKLVSFAGIGILTNMYHKKHLFVYDLVTKSGLRSRGFGKKLMGFLEKLGKKENCQKVVLTSRLERVDAHRFYESFGMRKKSYTFIKEI